MAMRRLPLGAHTTMKPHLFAASGALRLRRPKSRRGTRGEGSSKHTAPARPVDRSADAIEWAKRLAYMQAGGDVQTPAMLGFAALSHVDVHDNKTRFAVPRPVAGCVHRFRTLDQATLRRFLCPGDIPISRPDVSVAKSDLARSPIFRRPSAWG
jgi:hypothetical protein